ncbi:MAG: helix-turn-helix domain-containing protein [Chlorobium sp.]|nr:helix-turn-helix domain-containing protein [Chlorobium sp.]
MTANISPPCQSSAVQRQRILEHLKHDTLTTLQARHALDVMHPGMRICELRKAGHRIEMVWTRDVAPEGHWHRVGKYLLLPTRQLTLFDLMGRGGRP